MLNTANTINNSLKLEKRLLKHLTIENNKQFEEFSNDIIKRVNTKTRKPSNADEKV